MFLAGTTRLVLAWRLVNRCGEAGVAASAASAASDYEALVGLRKLENFISGLVVVDDGSDRNFQNYVAAIASGFVRALAVTSALGFVFGIETEMDQGVVALAGFHDDVAALAAVAPGGPAARDEFLASEGHAAVAAVAGGDSDFGFIDEHGRVVGRSSLVVQPKQKPRPEGEAAWRGRPRPRCCKRSTAYSISIGSTITNLPIEPLFRNLMRPVILAKSVSSLPRPTFSPGFTRVPRCRTMMVPPGTTCPPNALKPSRCAFESRPFREVPCPFLCAIRNSSKSSAGDPPAVPRASCPRSYFFFEGDFFAAFFGAAFFFACFLAFACAAGASCSSASCAFTFFGFASFLGNSGALKLCPSKAISEMRTAV